MLYDVDAVTASSKVRARRSTALGTACAAALLAAAICWAPVAVAAALPTGGSVTAGAASISSAGNQLTVDQTSAAAIIDWADFSIGAQSAVNFNNGAGATLNRVTGGTVSQIDGLLSASGSVYLINANGVIVGKSGVIQVGGRFVGSSLDVADQAFLDRGDMRLAGATGGAVINYGRIGSLGGDVALIAPVVLNGGRIDAPQGTVGLISGRDVLVRDRALDGGLFEVAVGGRDTSATNSGVITGIDAELRANGGNVYALAGNTGGMISATAVAESGGHIMLIADGGSVTAAGVLRARGPGGGGGLIETSGDDVQVAGADIDAGLGGTWLLDPVALELDQSFADVISHALGAGTDVVQQTAADTKGDILLDAGVSIHWSTQADLVLSAARDIVFLPGSTVVSTGGGDLVLRADSRGRGRGGVSLADGSIDFSHGFGRVTILYNSTGDHKYRNAIDYASWIRLNGAVPGQLSADMLVNNVTDLQDISDNLAGHYALGRNIHAKATADWNGGAGFDPIGDESLAFTGTLDGRGHTINLLTIDDRRDTDVGLFAVIGAGASVHDLKLAAIRFASTPSNARAGRLGGLAGLNAGTISNVSVSGRLSTSALCAGGQCEMVGGVVGDNTGDISDSTANIDIRGKTPGGGPGGPGGAFLGGLVGWNEGSIRGSTSQGSMFGDWIGTTGGLVGENFIGATITASSSSVDITSVFNNAGGLAGSNDGSISDSHASGDIFGNWSATLGGLVGQNWGPIENSYATGRVQGRGVISGQWSGAPAVGGLTGYNGFGGSITHSYATGEVSGTGVCTAVVCDEATVGGLVGVNISDRDVQIADSYATGDVSGSIAVIGGLVGLNNDASGKGGLIFQSFATGAVTVKGPSFGFAGGLVGQNDGRIEQSYATGEVSSRVKAVTDIDSSFAGGLVAINYGSIVDSYATGEVQSRLTGEGDQTFNYAAGLVASNKGLIETSYATGRVSSIGLSRTAGGLVAHDDGGQVLHSYWDKQTTGQRSSAGGRGLTTAQLQDGLPAGFSDSVWGDETGDYPFLLWQAPPSP